MPRMDAGTLDTRLILLRMDKVKKESGEVVEVPVAIATVWGAVRPVRGSESFASQARYAEVEVKFEIRYRKELDATTRIRRGKQEFDVIELLALPGGRPERLEILAKARADETGA